VIALPPLFAGAVKATLACPLPAAGTTPVGAPGSPAGTTALLAWLAGWWSLRGVVQRPVALTLRQAE